MAPTTDDTRLGFGGLLLRFALLGLATEALAVVLGLVPTFRLSGAGGVRAMFAGLAVAWLANLAGAVPMCLAVAQDGKRRLNAALASTAVRMVVVLLLVLSAALSGVFMLAPLLIWVAIGYLLLVAVDTTYAVYCVKPPQGGGPDERGPSFDGGTDKGRTAASGIGG